MLLRHGNAADTPAMDVWRARALLLMLVVDTDRGLCELTRAGAKLAVDAIDCLARWLCFCMVSCLDIDDELGEENDDFDSSEASLLVDMRLDCDHFLYEVCL